MPDFRLTEQIATAAVPAARKLRRAARLHFRCGHWLCQLLADTADIINPATLSCSMARTAEQAMTQFLEVPGWIAKPAGHFVQEISDTALVGVMPHAQLAFGLRVLAIAVCPAPARCPAQTQLAPSILQCSLAPEE